MISEQNFLNLEGLRYFKEKILDTTSTLISETFNQALPITGGSVSGTIQVSTDGGNRKILIGGSSNNIKFTQSDTSDAWATGVLLRNSTDTITLGTYGFRLNAGDTLNYYYIGNNSEDPAFKMTPDGKITLKTALPVKSGGTGATTALGAANNLQVYSLGATTTIAANTDLNTLTTVGSYSCNDVTTANTLVNSPYTIRGFNLRVIGTNGGTTHLSQELVPFQPSDPLYYRRRDEGVWSDWYGVSRHAAPETEYLLSVPNNDQISVNKTLSLRAGTVPYGDTVDGTYNSAFGAYTSGGVSVDFGSLIRAQWSERYYTDLWLDANNKKIMFRQVVSGVSQGWKQLVDTSGATMTGTLVLESSDFSNGLIVKRAGTNGAGVKFSNSNGVMGILGFTNDGALRRYESDGTTSHKILDDAGGTVTGSFQTNDNHIIYRAAQWPNAQFRRGDVGIVGYIQEQCAGGATSNYFGFKQASRSSTDFKALSYSETYCLPSTNADRTSDASYAILTSKNTVTISQGGTGSATKTGARENLGIKSGTSLPSTGTAGDIFFLHS